jgi:hypothetical protein
VTDQAELICILDDWHETCFRLESLDEYNVEHEASRLEAYLRGDPVRPYHEGQQAWLEELRRESSEGKRRTRVHAIGGPLTPYLQYEIEWAYTANVDAGEDVRILHRESWAETPFGDRPPDFYLLDDQVVVVMQYDAEGHWLGGEVITDPMEVGRYRDIRDRALAEAVPFREYLAARRRTPSPPPPLMQPAALRTSA